MTKEELHKRRSVIGITPVKNKRYTVSELRRIKSKEALKDKMFIVVHECSALEDVGENKKKFNRTTVIEPTVYTRISDAKARLKEYADEKTELFLKSVPAEDAKHCVKPKTAYWNDTKNHVYDSSYIKELTIHKHEQKDKASRSI